MVYVCPFCRRRLISIWMLRYHIRSTHSSDVLGCPFCGDGRIFYGTKGLCLHASKRGDKQHTALRFILASNKTLPSYPQYMLPLAEQVFKAGVGG